MKTYTDLEQKRIIAENLQELIDHSGKDQKNIAIDLGINPPTFNQWVTGKATPQVSTLRKVANYFHVPFSYLINKRDDVESEKNIEVLPPFLAKKYSELDDRGKEIVNAAIDKEYDRLQKNITDFKRAMELDKITTIEDAQALLVDASAFGGYVSNENLIEMANNVLLKLKKEKQIRGIYEDK